MSGVFALRLGLGSVPASAPEVWQEIGGRLDAFAPHLAGDGSTLELSLTITARDLWIAVLTAMSAVTDTGYAVVALEARSAKPLGSPERDGPRASG